MSFEYAYALFVSVLNLPQFIMCISRAALAMHFESMHLNDLLGFFISALQQSSSRLLNQVVMCTVALDASQMAYCKHHAFWGLQL